MNASTTVLRRAAAAGLLISLLVATASSVGLLASFVEPKLDLHDLYRISTLGREAGFYILAVYLVAGFALLAAVGAGTDAKISNLESKGLNIICFICFLVIIFSPHTYVYPQGGGWITKTKAGTFSISSDMAIQYLWRALRMWSAIPLCLSISAAAFTWRFVRPTSQQ